jgi:hypothetical protein
MTKQQLIILCTVSVLIVGGLWLYGQDRGPRGFAGPSATVPNVGTPIAIPSVITANTPTVVTVTAQITDSTLIPGSVNLLRLGATGTQPTILGVMHDDGLNGDVKAGDQIYTLQVVFTEPTTGHIQTQVSAAFKGILRRVQSTNLLIYVWNAFDDPSSALHFYYPPTDEVLVDTVLQSVQVFSSNDLPSENPPLFTVASFTPFLTANGGLTLSDVINQRFNTAGILSQKPFANGMIVEYDDLPNLHYIAYNPNSGRAIDVFGFDSSMMTSSDFLILLDNIRF